MLVRRRAHVKPGSSAGVVGRQSGDTARHSERAHRASAMVRQMDAEGFGNCSIEGECEAVCPKEISLENIARMQREYFRAVLVGREK
jgi:succinate dehydrogenase/fumarate reductase-like Fe-S protein